jgi:hypothetical protein
MFSSSFIAPTSTSISEIHSFIYAAAPSLRRYHTLILVWRTAHATVHASLRSLAASLGSLACSVSEIYALVHVASPCVSRNIHFIILNAGYATWMNFEHTTLGRLRLPTIRARPTPSSEALTTL